MTALPRHSKLADYDPFVDSVGPVHESAAFLVERFQDDIAQKTGFRKSLLPGASS